MKKSRIVIITVVATLVIVSVVGLPIRRKITASRKPTVVRVEQARRFVRSGERTQIKVIRAEAGVAQRLEAIIVAENNLHDRERKLKRVLLNKTEPELQIAEDIGTIDYVHNQVLPLVTLDYMYNINGLGATMGNSLDLLLNKKFEDPRFRLRNRHSAGRCEGAMGTDRPKAGLIRSRALPWPQSNIQ